MMTNTGGIDDSAQYLVSPIAIVEGRWQKM